MAKNKKTYDDDDGRVIANMNVDGMPWHLRDGLQRRQKEQEERKDPNKLEFSDLTKEETREIVKGTMKAALLIGSIFMAGIGLFLLFCVYVWFR